MSVKTLVINILYSKIADFPNDSQNFAMTFANLKLHKKSNLMKLFRLDMLHL